MSITLHPFGFRANRPVAARDLFAYAEQVERSGKFAVDLETICLANPDTFQITGAIVNDNAVKMSLERIEQLRAYIDAHGLPPIQINLPSFNYDRLYVNGISVTTVKPKLEEIFSCPQ